MSLSLVINSCMYTSHDSHDFDRVTCLSRPPLTSVEGPHLEVEMVCIGHPELETYGVDTSTIGSPGGSKHFYFAPIPLLHESRQGPCIIYGLFVLDSPS